MSFIIAAGAIVVSAIAAWKARKYKKLYENTIKPKPLPHMGPKAITAREKQERWLEIRSQILLRDHFRCQAHKIGLSFCNYYKHLEVHHIIPRSKGGTDDPENLITLCQRCHAKKHGFNNRKVESKRRRHTTRNRRKKFKRYLMKNHKFLDIPVQTMEDVRPHQEDLSSEAVTRRKANYAKWEQDELGKPHN